MYNENKNGKVFILGAGFSKAFFDNAPLLIDDYEELDQIANKLPDKNPAKRIYELELEKNNTGLLTSGTSLEKKINIEKLMTRLTGRMPYDYDLTELQQLELDSFLEQVNNIYLWKLKMARDGKRYKQELTNFANSCIKNNINCITFNHDDYLDEALWNCYGEHGEIYWHPDDGYGFICRPSESIIRNWVLEPHETPMLLLKLHGSINWHIKKGYSCDDITVDSIVHNESWRPYSGQSNIGSYLEQPFWVPPIFEKSSFAREPILRIIWSKAFNKLENASHITFIGYSLPETDNIIEFFLREAIKNKNVKIKVVDKKDDKIGKDKLIEKYRKLFPSMKEEDFYFGGAKDWTKENCI